VSEQSFPVPLLTRAHLERLEGALREQGAPVLEQVRPGASPERLARPLANGITLSAEARLWWGWHDGTSATKYTWDRSIGPDFAFLSLDEAVDEYHTLRRLARMVLEKTQDDPDSLWNPQWLPFTRDPVGWGGIGCDCSKPAEPSPIVRVIWSDWQNPVSHAAPSFGALVERWLRALEIGAWAYDRTRRAWIHEPERFGPEASRPALI